MNTSRTPFRFCAIALVSGVGLWFEPWGLLFPQARAQERPTLSGTWAAGPLVERWNIGAWGNACGPKPAGKSTAGGSIGVTEGGGELSFSGAGYPRTTVCFDMGVGIRVISHTPSSRSWRTQCATAPNDPRRATINTSLSATDTAISFDETGEYQVLLKGQNCTASVRRNRTYTLVRREGESPASTPPVAVNSGGAAAPPAEPTPPLPTDTCANPGEPARFEVRPSHKLMKIGESFVFRATVLDSAGCRLSQTPRWAVLGQDYSHVTVTPTGVVSVADGTSEGEVGVQATLKDKTVRVFVEVVASDKYQELLAARHVNASGESDDAASVTIATGGLGGVSVVAQDSAHRRKGIFLAIVGACVAALSVVGVVLWRRHKPQVQEVEEWVPGETRMRVVRKKRLVPRAQAAALLCPQCGRGFAAGAVFCSEDGEKLVAAAPASPPVPVPPPEGHQEKVKICPVCGRSYGANAIFCGQEGAQLVRIN